MKRIPALLVLLAAFSLPIGCQNGFPFGHTASAPTPPPNPLSVSVTFTGYGGVGPVTIRPGGFVQFCNQSGSDPIGVNPDDGAGNCTSNYPVPLGGCLSVTFSAAGTYNYHCDIFGYCNDFACQSPCYGMSGAVYVF